jgi:DNA-binding response OmpR family regulator
MANSQKIRALVVDDEVMMRRLLLRALGERGFECDVAADGIEAEKMAAANDYDAVVTDLKMPNKHGHALATFLLTLERRPVIVIHTGVMEPRLAKDLLARGVDDILFKPCDFSVLAAKVDALVQRRAELRESAQKQSVDPQAEKSYEAPFPGASIDASQLTVKSSRVSEETPIAPLASDLNNSATADHAKTVHLESRVEPGRLGATTCSDLTQSSAWPSSIFHWLSTCLLGQAR